MGMPAAAMALPLRSPAPVGAGSGHGSWHCQGCRSICAPLSPSSTCLDPDPEAEVEGSRWHRTSPSHNLQPHVPRSVAPSGGGAPWPPGTWVFGERFYFKVFI